MQNLIFGLLFLCFAVFAAGQTPQLPQHPNNLPTPKIKFLTPADLQVTSISFVSCTKDDGLKKLIITVSVTVKNNGQTKAGISNLQAFFQSPAGTATSKPISGTVRIAAINPGATVTGEYIFRRPFSADAGYQLVPFDFWVSADADHMISESNEANNGSASIRITPPAR